MWTLEVKAWAESGLRTTAACALWTEEKGTRTRVGLDFLTLFVLLLSTKAEVLSFYFSTTSLDPPLPLLNHEKPRRKPFLLITGHYPQILFLMCPQ